jgi:hypothetical protein
MKRMAAPPKNGIVIVATQELGRDVMMLDKCQRVVKSRHFRSCHVDSSLMVFWGMHKGGRSIVCG